MKILIVGSDSDYAIERYYRKHLAALGADVRIFPSADRVVRFHRKNLLNRVLFKTGLWTSYRAVNRALVAAVQEMKPDAVWVFKGMEIFPRTLEQLRQRCLLANYNPDHPFVISSRGSGNANVTQSVGLYHVHFCYHGQLMQELKRHFDVQAVFLPFAYDTDDIVYEAPERIVEIPRVCLQANPDGNRVRVVSLLTEHGFDVDVIGIGWQKTCLASNPKVGISGILPRAGFWKKNQEYRVQLNLFREHNHLSHNMRTFEIPAVGGIELAPYSDEQAAFFEPEREMFFYRSDAELIGQAGRILGFGAQEAARVRAAARKRSVTSGYTFADRAATVFETFQTILHHTVSSKSRC